MKRYFKLVVYDNLCISDFQSPPLPFAVRPMVAHLPVFENETGKNVFYLDHIQRKRSRIGSTVLVTSRLTGVKR